MKLKIKLLVIFLAIALIPMFFISSIIYSNAKKNITNEVLSKLELIAALKEDQVNAVIEQNLERLSGVTSRTQLRKSLYDYNNTGDQEHLDKIESIIEDAKNSLPDFIEVAIISPKGETISFVSDTPTSPDLIPIEAIERGSQKPDIFLTVDDGVSSLYLTGPLFFGNQNIGSVVVQAIPNNIYAITETKEEITETFDLLFALRNENGDAAFITKQRFGDNENARSIIPKEELNIPMTQALLQNEDLFVNAIDYRGAKVLAATRYIDSQDWGLVVKIDASEPIGPILKLQQLVLFLGFISLILVMFIAYFVARSISDPIQNLTSVANDISRGKLDSRLDKDILNSKDEIGDLARAFERTVTSLKLAMFQKKEQESSIDSNEEKDKKV